jgi:hypothetical protein
MCWDQRYATADRSDRNESGRLPAFARAELTADRMLLVLGPLAEAGAGLRPTKVDASRAAESNQPVVRRVTRIRRHPFNPQGWCRGKPSVA